MNESEIERLRDLYHELEQAQRKLEALLAEKQSQLKTMLFCKQSLDRKSVV